VEYDGCNLCLVRIDGREGFVKACKTLAEDGMSVSTDSDELQKVRAENLVRTLDTHPHACLLCSQAEGCDRKICSIQIPEVSGVENIRQALLDEYGAADVAQYFTYEEDPMFTGKERQLTQQYMKQYSKMPPGNAELDDLF